MVAQPPAANVLDRESTTLAQFASLACSGLCRAQWALSVAWVCLGVLESSLGA